MPPKKKILAQLLPPKKKSVWSDDEVELLLNVAADYKASIAAESVDLHVFPHCHHAGITVLLYYGQPTEVGLTAEDAFSTTS